MTEHRAAVHDCLACGRRTRADFPEGVVSPAQYGERVKAAAIYLNAQQLVPEERTAQVLRDLFGRRRPAARAWRHGFAARPKR